MDQTDAQPIVELVKADLARYLTVPIDQIVAIEVAERTWPDRGLGCRARRGVWETAQTPGYLITLEHDGQRYSYHTDRATNFVRCVPPGKPLDPIMR